MEREKALTEKVLQIIADERDLNRDDPLVVALLTRLMNKIAQLEDEQDPS